MLDILEAAPGVVAQLDRARFVIAGGEEMPGQMDHVLRTIKERGLEKWMRILGDIERGEVLRIMSVSSVFLLPSYIEGMPISIMEAFRAGVPVIATPVGAIREMIVHGESGLIIRVGSPRDITESILKTASDETLRKDLIRGGLDVFHRKFDLTRGAEKVRVIYEDMIG
jgi:glycosyltransferase involved in cell wall biosynthesis